MEKNHVLVIEDNEDFAMMNCRYLKKAGFVAVATNSCEQALSQLSDVKPDVIVMDLTLPDMKPDEFLRHLRGDPSTAAIPVIVASGRDDIEQQTAQLGCQSFLKKPFEGQALIAAVLKLASV